MKMVKVKNISGKKIHIIVASGTHIVQPHCVFECTEEEFKMLKNFFNIVIIEEEKKIESEPSIVEEKIEEKEEKEEKKTSKKKSKK
jgi:hypothetical protein